MFESLLFALLLLVAGTMVTAPAMGRHVHAVAAWEQSVRPVQPWLGAGAALFGVYFLLRWTLWYPNVSVVVSNLLLITVGAALSADWFAARLPLPAALVGPIRRTHRGLARVQAPLGAICVLVGLYALFCVCEVLD